MFGPFGEHWGPFFYLNKLGVDDLSGLKLPLCRKLHLCVDRWYTLGLLEYTSGSICMNAFLVLVCLYSAVDLVATLDWINVRTGNAHNENNKQLGPGDGEFLVTIGDC